MFLGGVIHRYFLMARGVTLGVRGIVSLDDGKILLVRHRYEGGWYLPGGGVEKGEDVHEAIRRELCEETGLKLRGKPDLLGVFLNGAVSQRDHVVLFKCHAFDPLSARHRGIEVAEVGFFHPNALPESTDQGVVSRIQEIADGRGHGFKW